MITFTRQEIVWLRQDAAAKLNTYQRIAEDDNASPAEREIARLMRDNYAHLHGKLLDIWSGDVKRVAISGTQSRLRPCKSAGE